MKKDRKFSFVIPFRTADKKFLRRCTAAIDEQDYKNFEVIPVEDKDKKGAPWARNEGARSATGDYLFFLDVDCVLQPGVLTEIALTFDEYRDADFVYGQYRFFGKDLQIYPSRAWNPYVLESMNYLSTMSPMKREVFDAVGGFREDLPYFQDWDFFLRAVQKGKRGRFLKTVFFTTNEPDRESISGDPKFKFWEKVRHIQRLNDIPEKPICVTTFGAPFQGEYRAEVLGADYLGSNMQTELVWTPGLYGLHDYKMIYVMGFYPKAVAEHTTMFQNSGEDCLKVIHWIGTDVYQLRTVYNWESIKALKEDILSHMDAQFTTSPWLTEELAELGIDAPTLYAPIDAEKFPILPEPKQFAVGCYVSDTNPMHNDEFLLDVAKSMHDVKFFLFGRAIKDKHRNVEYVGRLENMRDILTETSLNLRMTVHDGLPQTVIQYLMSGRRAICNVPVEHASFIDMHPNEDNYSSAKSRVIWEIRQMKNTKYNGEEKKAARRHWAVRTDPAIYREAINGLLEVKKGNGVSDTMEVRP